MSYTEQITEHAVASILDLTADMVASGKLDRDLIERAVKGQAEIRHAKDFDRLSTGSVELLAVLTTSPMYAVIRKILQSVRLAAYTAQYEGKAAKYEDQPLFPDE